MRRGRNVDRQRHGRRGREIQHSISHHGDDVGARLVEVNQLGRTRPRNRAAPNEVAGACSTRRARDDKVARADVRIRTTHGNRRLRRPALQNAQQAQPNCRFFPSVFFAGHAIAFAPVEATPQSEFLHSNFRGLPRPNQSDMDRCRANVAASSVGGGATHIPRRVAGNNDGIIRAHKGKRLPGVPVGG